MGTMNISLPDSMREFVDKQVSTRGYGTSSEYVRELIRRDQDRQHLRELLVEGAASAPTAPVDADYFEGLRKQVRQRSGAPRYAHELNMPDLRFWLVLGYPYVVFYVERDDHVDVWRVLHAKRDIPAWMAD